MGVCKLSKINFVWGPLKWMNEWKTCTVLKFDLVHFNGPQTKFIFYCLNKHPVYAMLYAVRYRYVTWSAVLVWMVEWSAVCCVPCAVQCVVCPWCEWSVPALISQGWVASSQLLVRCHAFLPFRSLNQISFITLFMFHCLLETYFEVPPVGGGDRWRSLRSGLAMIGDLIALIARHQDHQLLIA